MSKKSLLLSTPDLRQNPIVQHLEPYYEHVFSPRLKQIKGYPSNTIESQITALHQKILQDQQRSWYQNICIPDDSFKNHEYQETIKPLLERLEQKDWLLHDPLLVHCLPMWLPKIESPSIIFYYSAPMECAHALQQSWRFPLAFGLALWEHYVLTACKNVKNDDCILVSSSKLRQSPKKHLQPILSKLGIAQAKDWSVFSTTESPKLSEHAGALQQNQQQIFEVLESGDLSSLYDRSLSDESLDILNYYGQLRSGFETVKAERDALRSKLSVGQNKIKPTAIEPTTAESFDHTEDSLCKVRVYVEGMDMLEFYADPSSPVLDMLQSHLVNIEQDELIYLNYGDNENDTLYFMSSDLLAMETEPANQY
jgi:hypothetical protein